MQRLPHASAKSKIVLSAQNEQEHEHVSECTQHERERPLEHDHEQRTEYRRAHAKRPKEAEPPKVLAQILKPSQQREAQMPTEEQSNGTSPEQSWQEGTRTKAADNLPPHPRTDFEPRKF